METRKERYAKYREQIRLTPDDQFSSSRRSTPINSQDIDLLSSVDKPSMAISYGSLLEPYEAKFSSNGEKTISPYDRYLKRRRVGAIIKLSLFLIAIVGMLVWYYIAFIRS